MAVARGWGMWEMGGLVKGYKVLIMEGNKVLDIYCTT